MLIGKNINIRDLEEKDVDFLYSIENNENLWKYGSERIVFSKLLLLEYIKNSKLGVEINRQIKFIIDLKDCPIGIIDIYDYHKDSASIGIFIIDEYRNKGYGKESLELLKCYCKTKLMIKKLFCCIDIHNLNSVKLFMSTGFKEKSIFKESKHFRLDL